MTIIPYHRPGPTMTDDDLMRENRELRSRIMTLEAQLSLTSRAWKAWENTLREKDIEIAELRAELRRKKYER